MRVFRLRVITAARHVANADAVMLCAILFRHRPSTLRLRDTRAVCARHVLNAAPVDLFTKRRSAPRSFSLRLTR